MSWIIRQITCQDIKGFNGRYEFTFESGLNVIHGPNGQGKSSVVDSLRWALIGELPKVEAIRAPSQSLINKNAGMANGIPEVIVELINSENDEEMIITRRGHKKPTAANESSGLTDMQKESGLEALEVSVSGNHYTGWNGDAQETIEEQLGLKSSTLAKCSVVGQEDIMAIIAGKETDMNNLMHDLLDLRTLVNIGPILKQGKKDAEARRKSLNSELEGPTSPIKLWESNNTQLNENLVTKQENAREEFGFDWGEVESTPQIEEAIMQRLIDCESTLNSDFSGLELSERVTEIQNTVDEFARQDPTHERLRNLAIESEKVVRLIEDLESESEFWNERKDEMSELLGNEELNLLALATAKQEKVGLYKEKKDEKESLDLSEKLSTSVMDHLEAHSDLEECPICNSPAEYATLRTVAEALMGPKLVARRSELNSEVETLSGEVDDLSTKYESAEQLHTSIHAGVKDFSAVVDRLLDGMEIAEHSAEELLTGSLEISNFVTEIENVKAICEKRQTAIEKEQEQLEKQSETWREEIMEPLRATLREVSALIQLLTSFSAIDNHADRFEEAEVAQSELRSRLNQARELKAMLGGLESALTASQQANASQRIEEALPQINDIFSAVCTNPQYDRLQVDCGIKNGNIVYSFRTLPEQRAFGDVAAVVLSGGNQAVASIAALMALAAGGSHQFPTLVLDDPCVQMDPETIERWAGAASEFAQNQQLIVLTHQPDVADYLEKNGASRDDLHGWNQGVLPGRGD